MCACYGCKQKLNYLYERKNETNISTCDSKFDNITANPLKNSNKTVDNLSVYRCLIKNIFVGISTAITSSQNRPLKLPLLTSKAV